MSSIPHESLNSVEPKKAAAVAPDRKDLEASRAIPSPGQSPRRLDSLEEDGVIAGSPLEGAAYRAGVLKVRTFRYERSEKGLAQRARAMLHR
jgi:hypothetical protein